MKTSVSSYSFYRYLQETKCSYLEICDIAKEMGFDGIEFIDLVNEKWGKLGDPIEMAKEIKAHCEKIGLDIVSYTVTGLFLPDPKKECERLKTCVDIAKVLGAPLMRHDVTFELRDEPLYTYKDAIEETYKYIDELSNYAKSKGIKTCTENHGFSFGDSYRVEEVIKKVNNKNFGMLVDIGNFLCVDEDPITALSRVSGYAFHVHAKDFLFKSGDVLKPGGWWTVTTGGNYLRGTILGHGVVPVKACINALKQAKYDGYISLEFEGREVCLDGIRDGLEFLKKVIEND
ncbi:MAG: sugar phosphate isomerase/epimerase [Clostridia bacterium]|nr:sugar phosphate isomerase/epimerase [Clostridia bacterium]